MEIESAFSQPLAQTARRRSAQGAPLDRARAKLRPRREPERTWPAVAAAAFFALSALAFATAAILAPPVTMEHATAQIVR